MGLSYQEELTLPFELCDVKSDIKLPLLLDYCLMVSGRQSAQLGRSNNNLLVDYKLVWIVTDYEITIHRLPHFQETITIETKALSYNKFFCYRQFYIYDQEGGSFSGYLSLFCFVKPRYAKSGNYSRRFSSAI
ncbi:hypothetical protein B0685_03740 [Streptococcus pyogenes]|nr:hypothetical protein B0685_03740 [Streptococcus pyogenes]